MPRRSAPPVVLICMTDTRVGATSPAPSTRSRSATKRAHSVLAAPSRAIYGRVRSRGASKNIARFVIRATAHPPRSVVSCARPPEDSSEHSWLRVPRLVFASPRYSTRFEASCQPESTTHRDNDTPTDASSCARPCVACHSPCLEPVELGHARRTHLFDKLRERDRRRERSPDSTQFRSGESRRRTVGATQRARLKRPRHMAQRQSSRRFGDNDGTHIRPSARKWANHRARRGCV